MARDSGPLIWRIRGKLQDAFAYVAMAIVAMGLFVTGYSIVIGPIEGIAPGLTLVVGGALILVMRRGKR